MLPNRTIKGLTGALVLAALTACVDAPSEPLAANTFNNPLATSFEMLAHDQMAANDVERSEEFRWAALALRAGVNPSVLEVTNNGRAELYDAFVHSVTWVSLTQALRPPTHRSLVAWRRNGDVLQVLLVGMFTDSAPVLNPYSMRSPSPGTIAQSPVAGANAAYFERGPNGSSWLGVNGVAKVAEHPQPRACPTTDDASRPVGVTCQLTRYGTSLNVLFARTRTEISRELDANTVTRRLIVPNQIVAGVKLVFSCAMPRNTGCN